MFRRFQGLLLQQHTASHAVEDDYDDEPNDYPKLPTATLGARCGMLGQSTAQWILVVSQMCGFSSRGRLPFRHDAFPGFL